MIIRNIFRNVYFSFITVGSLVIGVTAAVVIFLWDRYELSFNSQNPDAKYVYHVMVNELVDGEVETNDETDVHLTDFFSNEVPEVEASTRFDATQLQFSIKENVIRKSGAYTDKEFFGIFNMRILEGSATTPLPDGKNIAISDAFAQLLFGTASAVGQIVTLDGMKQFVVSSVFQSFPKNNSFSYINFVLPYSAVNRNSVESMDKYYVKLHKNSSKEAAEMKIDNKFISVGRPELRSLLFCQTDWRLHWEFKNGRPSGGRIVYLLIFNITAGLILVMACINYVNMATARSTKRAKEIGVRKVNGATRKSLMKQFLFESLMLSFSATGISIVLVYLLQPLFSELTGLAVHIDVTDPILFCGLATIAITIALIAGGYPAFILSSFKPAFVLKGNIYSGLTAVNFRRTLMSIQLTLSIVMIFVSLVIRNQTSYLLNSDLGYDKQNVINVWMPTDAITPSEAFKYEITKHPSVKAAGFSGASPMEINGSAEAKWSGLAPDKHVYLYGTCADYDLIPTLGLKIIKGRNFSKELISDSSNFIINKKAAEILGFDDPIGQQITYEMTGNRRGEIIGIVDDFNNDDIHLPRAPVLFYVGKPSQLYNFFIKYQKGQEISAVENLKKVFDKFYHGITFDYSFLDKDFELQLNREMALGKLSLVLTVVAIVIALLGLIGQAVFNVEKRTKEIGIRKILGASVSQIMVLFYKDFLKPVLFSFAIAFAISSYVTQLYLESFAYRVLLQFHCS